MGEVRGPGDLKGFKQTINVKLRENQRYKKLNIEVCETRKM